MKKVLGLLVALLLCFSSFASAENSDWEEPEYGEVQSYDFNFSVTSDGAAVKATWEAFEDSKNMKWYKLVYSEDDSTPTYPENKAHFVGYNSTKTSDTLWLKSGNMYYLRLCAITHDNERYCSDVQELELEQKEYQQKYADKKEVYQVKKVEYKGVKEEKKELKNNDGEISSSLKDRIDTALEKFINRLEGKGYSDEKMVSVIGQVIDRLEGFKKNEKHARMASYMIEVLEEYQQEYDDSFGDLEDLLNDF